MEEALWGDMLDVLKDISSYLSKDADTDMEKTTLNAEDFARPKTGESQAKKDPIKHGTDPSGKPGEDVIKAEDDDDDDDEDDEDKDEKDEDVEELKSLLKDIRAAMTPPSASVDQKSFAAEIKKSIREEIKAQMPNTLRKMGFSPSRPDIVKLGLEDAYQTQDAQAAQINVDLKKAEDIVVDLSKKSWRELAALREHAGDFNPFQK